MSSHVGGQVLDSHMAPQVGRLQADVDNVGSGASLDHWKDLPEVSAEQCGDASHGLLDSCDILQCAVYSFIG